MLFETYLKDDDVRALVTGKMYDDIDKDYFETQRCLAILEIGYLDIELNICRSYDDDQDLRPAYFICKKCRDDDDPDGMWEYWEGEGYADEVLPHNEGVPNIDWSVDYKYQLREDMERVLKLYAEKAGLYFDKPNKSMSNLKSWII